MKTVLHARRRYWPALSLAPVAVLLGVLCAIAHGRRACAQGADGALSILPPLSNGWFRLEMPAAANEKVELLASPDLRQWTNIAVAHGGLIAWPDPVSTNGSQRFYRARRSPRTSADDGKNQLVFPYDPFLAGGNAFDQPRWVKFAILTADPVRVFYQDSGKYPFHYDFARARLEPFRGMSTEEFDQVSLHPTNQMIALGAVLVPPGDNVVEYGIQFVGLEPYPPETVVRFFELVRATVVAPPGVNALYLPTREQAASAAAHRDYFASRGIPISSVERWARGDAIYASGWALGRLTHVATDDLEAAYAAGRLRPTDILLLDAVPAEVPFVAGIIAQQPATPNSHVAILARSYGVPFGHLVDETARARLYTLTNRLVVLRAYPSYAGNRIEVIDLEGQLDPELQAELLALKEPPAIDIVPKATLGAYWMDPTNLIPADIRYFGGKAANFGLLRRRLPSHSPPAIAFSFDLWDAFMAQPFFNGQTLREAISNRLARYTYPPDMPALTADLAVVRDWIEDLAAFSGPLQQVITNALRQFDPQRKIRFRSSTNVEDSEHFTGAGLYESRSGCLLDDWDGDLVGPSRCDPAHANEHGVFRALKKVYASLYGDQAFLERLRHRVNETAVGMGVLVHHSFPDPEEMANGVATLTKGGGPSYQLELVTQKGAVSVTNPDGSALPEVVQGGKYSFGTYVNLEQRSTLVPLGGYVMDWQENYLELVNLLSAVADGYRELFPQKTGFVLDFEYKKMAPGNLIVKQVRELPAVGDNTEIAPYLINQPTDYVLFQGEYGDVFANHRLKCRWHIETRNLQLTDANLRRTFYTNLINTFLRDNGPDTLSGVPDTWPAAGHTWAKGELTERWSVADGPQRRDFELTVRPDTGVPVTEPIVLLSDYPLYLTVNYAVPVRALDYSDRPVWVTTEVAQLAPPLPLTPASLLQQRTLAGTNGVTVETTFYWPKPPSGVVAGYTAPLVQFVETRITGLTATPLVLRDYFAQTYRPGHHNFTEDFLFEPRLDSNVTAAQRAELAEANVQLIFMRTGSALHPSPLLIGFDGEVR